MENQQPNQKQIEQDPLIVPQEEVLIELPSGIRINLKSTLYDVQELTAQALGIEQYFENKTQTKTKPTGVS